MLRFGLACIGLSFLIFSYLFQRNIAETIQSISQSPLTTGYIQAIFFAVYLPVFVNILYSFLKHPQIKFLFLPSVSALVYFIIVLWNNVSTYTFSGMMTLPVTIFAYSWKQLFNPILSFPGLFRSNGFTNFMPSYLLFFAVIPNLSYVYLFFGGSKFHTLSITT